MNWDVVGGWVIIGVSLLTIVGVILACACGYGDDPE